MDEHSHQSRGGWSTVSKLVFWGFILVGGFFLITEHRAHLFGILPFLLLAACPLMHLFHHHGGHGHGGHDEDQRDRETDDRGAPRSGDGSQIPGHDHNHH